ncbi:MAG: Ig-like domain-containing protein, partial [Bacteroidota bacterium]
NMRSNQIIAFDYQAATDGYKDNYTFEGRLPNGNDVRLTIDENFIYGYFEQEGQLLFIEPLRFVLPDQTTENHYIFYKENNVIDKGPSICAANDLDAHANGFESHANHRKSSGCLQVDLAIASDKGMFNRYGSVADVEDRNVGIMNNVQGDYDNAFNDEIRFVIVEQVVVTDNSDPFGTIANSDISIALSTFTNWAALGGFSSSHDLGQLWSATDLTLVDVNGNVSTAVVGLAYFPGVCNGSFKYHVLEDFQGTSGLMRALVSHEIGHNFLATHDDISGQNIMNSFLTDTQVWSNQSKTEINGHITSSSCQTGSSALGTCSGGGGNTNIQPNVNFITPNNGASFPQNANINVQASANDPDGTVTQVELFLNGFSQGIDFAPPHQWTVQSDFVGENFLQVVALDNDGGTDQETISINITASSNIPPSVNITSPNDGQDFELDSNIIVRASASDSDGSVSSVELFVNGFSEGVDNQPPYRWTLDNLSVGSYDLEAIATDNQGATDVDMIVISVSEGGGNCEDEVVVMGEASGTYTATNSLETSGTVNVFNSATFQAGDVVRLNPGFWASDGSSFLAEIITTESCADATIEARSTNLPSKIALYPNPANGFTTLSFELARAGFAAIELYNASGKYLKNVLSSNRLLAGKHQIELNTSNLETGLFYVILKTENGTHSQKLVVVN